MKGQALITLIFFTLIATTITTAAIIVIAANSISGSRFQDGAIAYGIAQSGAENALIRILRNPSYTGETLNIGNGTAVVGVSGSGTSANPYIINSQGQIYNFVKKVEVTATYENEELNVVSQKEVF